MAINHRVSIEAAERELTDARKDYLRLINIPAPLLMRAIDEQLTDTQKKYLIEYYFHAKTLEIISKEYGISIPTVSRTIKRARKRLIEAFRYYKAIK